MTQDLKQTIKDKARQLGFILAGVTLPETPLHYSTFENWLAQGHHGTMNYLAEERSRFRRADPKQILPECRSILVLATPYSSPSRAPEKHRDYSERSEPAGERRRSAGGVAISGYYASVFLQVT